MNDPLYISIIVPAYNAGGHLGECLDALLGSSSESCEIIVVDDASTDDTARIAQAKGVTVLRCPEQSGPAGARNLGAGKAKGEVLFFVDADVRVMEGAVARVMKRFREEADVDALFGSYDDDPRETSFLSQYKNLFHHYVHQQSNEEAVTFWAGCGAIRKEVFRKVGGFDKERYRAPSIEDIELGYRLKKMGCRIVLDKSLQGKHLKRWTLGSLLRADIFCRAVPWSMLMLENKELATDLNLKWHSKLSSFLVGLLLVMLALTPLAGGFLCGVGVILVILVALNLDFYQLLLRKRGPGFAILAFPMHLLYYFYSGFTFVLCWAIHKRKESRGDPP
jgi:GT2 family glycosyltransferase